MKKLILILKIPIIILIAFIANGGCGQSPKLDTTGKIFRVVKFKEGTTKPYIYYVKDTMFIELNLDVDTIYIFDLFIEKQIDSSKIYWQQFNKYQRLMNEELEKLNRLQNPQMTRKVFRYQDSCKRYQELLNKLKK